MKKLLVVIIALSAFVFAEVQNVIATPDFMTKGIPVIDIRTPGEWKETGTVQGAYTIMFFDEQGKYNVEDFMTKLNKAVKKGEPFALICRTGSRTAMVSDFLDKQFGYKVINLQGGMVHLMQQGYAPVPYGIK